MAKTKHPKGKSATTKPAVTPGDLRQESMTPSRDAPTVQQPPMEEHANEPPERRTSLKDKQRNQRR